ncbi:expressed unknown protein [Seminavis robusta]|uniref:Uncharacterized protein n=1 Tax=Seminavis robusta TaxID=568900 RepID=A0A9N8D7D5_9STRA|nr:expressed unknown protein [Seminavis robusta]|eukprot:Sro6_g005610.1 n/a (193) ;mRNA; r:259260-259838
MKSSVAVNRIMPCWIIGVVLIATTTVVDVQGFQTNRIQVGSPKMLRPSTLHQRHSQLLTKSSSTSTQLGMQDMSWLLLSDASTPPQLITANNNADVWVFVAGVIPFAWATIEFWRRIAVGESFGTGSDSVTIIGQDNNPESSRGRRVLGKDALIVAYILFGIVAGVLGLVLYTVLSTTSSPTEFVPLSDPGN